MTPSRSRPAVLLAASIALAAAGCSGTGAVAGKVTYLGQPVANATVTFATPDGMTYQTGTATDGSYRVDNVPKGPTVVTVVGALKPTSGDVKMNEKEAVGRAADPSTAPPAGATVEIPIEYSNPGSSGLSFEVGGGTSTFDINLEKR